MSATSERSGASALAVVRFCPHCNKVFDREYPHNRHVAYCQRAKSKRKGRPKPCSACSASKTKCSLGRPLCLRCSSKGLVCVYDAAVGRPGEPRDSGPGSGENATGSGGPTYRGPLPTTVPPVDSIDVYPSPETDVEAGLAGGRNRNLAGATRYRSRPPTTSAVSRDGRESPDQISSLGRPQYVAPRSGVPAGVTVPFAGAALTPRHVGPSAAEQGARLMLHVVRAFPEMMLRRQTFPPFIHQHWHSPALPEQLATCMSIAQLFASGAVENRPFVWRSIDGEDRRFRRELETYDKHVVLAAMQALIIYTIMAIVEPGHEEPPRHARLSLTFQLLLTTLLGLMDGAPFSEPEWANRSETWEDYVFAESRRRIGCLWFSITRIMFRSAACGGVGLLGYRDKPLCTSKGMWEARSREEWELERAFFEGSLLHTDLWRFGALVDARRGYGPINQVRLDAWEAGTDKMGLLMSIAMSMVEPDGS